MTEHKLALIHAVTTILFVVFILVTLSGCVMNDNAATASMHNSDNRAATEQQRIQSELAAQRAIAQERTNQVLITQQGATERLYAFQMYSLTRQSENTNRLIIVLAVIVLLILLGSAIYLYMWRQWNQPLYTPRQVEMFPSVPFSALSDPRFSESGWSVSGNYLVRHKDGIEQKALLFESGS